MTALVLGIVAFVLVVAIMTALTVVQQRAIKRFAGIVVDQAKEIAELKTEIAELKRDRDNHRHRIEVLEDHPDFRLLRAVASEALDRARGLEIRVTAVEGERDEMRQARDEAFASIESLKRQLRKSEANGSGEPHQDESA